MHKRRPSFTQCQQQYDNQLPPEDPQGDAEEAYWGKVDKETAQISNDHERTTEAFLDFITYINHNGWDDKNLGYNDIDLHNAIYDLIGTPQIRSDRDRATNHPLNIIMDAAIRWQAKQDIGPFNGR